MEMSFSRGLPDGQDAGCYHGTWGSMGLARVFRLFAVLLIILKSTAMYAASLIQYLPDGTASGECSVLPSMSYIDFVTNISLVRLYLSFL